MASEYDTYVERLVKPIVTERRIRWIWQIWCYALVLFLVTGGVASFLSGSPRLLLPILGVCFTGGVVGTLVAILRSISEYEHLAKVLRMEDKIIRRLNATESDDQMRKDYVRLELNRYLSMSGWASGNRNIFH